MRHEYSRLPFLPIRRTLHLGRLSFPAVSTGKGLPLSEGSFACSVNGQGEIFQVDLRKEMRGNWMEKGKRF